MRLAMQHGKLGTCQRSKVQTYCTKCGIFLYGMYNTTGGSQVVGTELETQDRRMRRGVCQEKTGLIRSSTWASRTGTGAVRRTKNTYPSHLGREQNGRKLTVLGKSSADPALRFPALRNAGGRAKRGSLPRPCPALPCPGLPWLFYCVITLRHPQPQCTASKSATEQRAVYNLSAQTPTAMGD